MDLSMVRTRSLVSNKNSKNIFCFSFNFTGGDVFQTFLASGLPNFVLSHIWNICDIGQTGKLNAEQFALASYFISLKLQGSLNTLPFIHLVYCFF